MQNIIIEMMGVGLGLATQIGMLTYLYAKRSEAQSKLLGEIRKAQMGQISSKQYLAAHIEKAPANEQPRLRDLADKVGDATWEALFQAYVSQVERDNQQ